MNASTLGIFTDSLDIGDVGASGSASVEDGAYAVAGAGYNMWFERDACHFVWTRVDGDISLSADVRFPAAGSDPHRKACLMIRQDLSEGSVYADIAVHGDGLTSLQYRVDDGGATREIQAAVTAPGRIGIERRGRFVSATVDGSPSGGSVQLDLSGAVYIGLAVCSHIEGVLEEAVFTNVALEPVVAGRRLMSTLEIIDIASTDRRVVGVFDGRIEAPNWTDDGSLVCNGDGRLFEIPVGGGAAVTIDTGFAVACNNDHGISPDGAWIAISDQSQDDGLSVVYVVPIAGGQPRRVTDHAPSYWHGWSPDGTTLAYCAERDGSFGIFTIPVEGGQETRLTTTEGLDDGPDYTPDGQWIYFNSDRTGVMQIHRVRPDGTDLELVLADGWADWFPHPSPDGRSIAVLSYQRDVVGHPADHDVLLRLIDLESGEVSLLATVFGGQGTINVPSWSPDASELAFVSYTYL